MQEPRLGHFHALGIAGPLMIEPSQMQRAMHDEMGEMVSGPSPCRRCLALHHPEREHQLTAGIRAIRVAEHIGWLVAPAMPRIEPLYCTIVRKYDTSGPARQGCRARRNPFSAAHDATPAGGHDNNRDPRLRGAATTAWVHR
jgi:hypothetical protein